MVVRRPLPPVHAFGAVAVSDASNSESAFVIALSWLSQSVGGNLTNTRGVLSCPP